jgi:uncharacterized protein (DUF952 family)
MICHITTRAAWEAAKVSGEFRPPEFADHGMVHCSTPEQVLLIANAFFRGKTGLLLLIIDPARLESPVRWEPPDANLGRLPGFTENAVFPHVYGPINLDAVVRTVSLDPTETGSFILPRPA